MVVVEWQAVRSIYLLERCVRRVEVVVVGSGVTRIAVRWMALATCPIGAGAVALAACLLACLLEA